MFVIKFIVLSFTSKLLKFMLIYAFALCHLKALLPRQHCFAGRGSKAIRVMTSQDNSRGDGERSEVFENSGIKHLFVCELQQSRQSNC